MNSILQKTYEEFLTVWEYTKSEDYTEQEKRLIFLANEVLGITTYCDEYSLEIGSRLLDIMKWIYGKQNVVEKLEPKYSYSEENLEFDYIVYVQFIKEYLNWGVSIYSAWFDSSKEILGYKLTSKNVTYLISWFDGIEE